MSVGLLIITHNGIGKDILTTATDIFGGLPMQVKVISISPNGSYDANLETAIKQIQDLDSGEGVLILTDIFGATPSNIAIKAARGKNACVITGINLPMVVRVLNYSQLPLKKIISKATSAGHDSIIECS
ncbi:MAG: PTS fructose transporter subunit IIA [Gammaproteobacteria bacterium]|nr:PTS fructose transporter subunit IIA [Gammaproteobacteria bacterium]